MKVKLERISDFDYQNYRQFSLDWGIFESKFGNILLAFHCDKLAYAKFFNGNQPPLHEVEKAWPGCLLNRNKQIDQKGEELFNEKLPEITVIVKGTDFETSVWKALLDIEKGTTCTYGDIAQKIGNPKAVRAVGTAVGHNRISYFIPCHRVIRKEGVLGNYGSGPDRKLKILTEENAL